MHLIIYGPEGSGKGTQAKKLSEKLRLPVFTSGDLVREAASNDTTVLGDECRKALNDGRYVSDSIMFQLWDKKLSSDDAKKGFILDGFPRNQKQADFLTQKTSQNGYEIDRVIFLSIPDEEAVKRLSARHREMYKGSSLNHDTPERITARLYTYHAMEKPLIDFYRSKNLLLSVDGIGTPEEIFQKIITGLGMSS